MVKLEGFTARGGLGEAANRTGWGQTSGPVPIFVGVAIATVGMNAVAVNQHNMAAATLAAGGLAMAAAATLSPP